MYFVMVTRRTYVTFCSGVMVKKSSQGRKLQMSDRIPTGEIMGAQIFRFLKISQKGAGFRRKFRISGRQFFDKKIFPPFTDSAKFSDGRGMLPPLSILSPWPGRYWCCHFLCVLWGEQILEWSGRCVTVAESDSPSVVATKYRKFGDTQEVRQLARDVIRWECRPYPSMPVSYTHLTLPTNREV